MNKIELYKEIENCVLAMCDTDARFMESVPQIRRVFNYSIEEVVDLLANHHVTSPASNLLRAGAMGIVVEGVVNSYKPLTTDDNLKDIINKITNLDEVSYDFIIKLIDSVVD